MAATSSTMVPLGTPAPDFRLPDTTGKWVTLADFKGVPALLVVFMCNHCPYVRHIRAALDAVLACKPASPRQKPSLGCYIKWKPVNEPDYFG